jgi:hypothetical protein
MDLESLSTLEKIGLTFVVSGSVAMIGSLRYLSSMVSQMINGARDRRAVSDYEEPIQAEEPIDLSCMRNYI